VTTAGQRHDSLAFEPLMGAATDHPDRAGPTTDPTRAAARRQGVLEPGHPLPSAATPDQSHDPGEERPAEGPNGEGPAGGRPPAFDPEAYKQRNTAVRASNKLKALRAVALRTDKREFVFQGTIDVASINIWLRHLV
jgi:transposase